MGLSVSKISSTDYSNWFSTKREQSDSQFSLADWASLKNGTYKKLTDYYTGKKQSRAVIDEQKQEKAKEKIEYQATRSAAVGLSSALVKLQNDKIYQDTEEDREQLKKALKDFSEKYNAMIKNGAESSDATVIRNTYYMTTQSSVSENLLNKAGFTINSDNTLSFDEENFDSKRVASLFNTKYGYGNAIENRSENIISRSTNLIGNISNGYTAAGTYKTTEIDTNLLYNNYI